jgi:hypothetical protein
MQIMSREQFDKKRATARKSMSSLKTLLAELAVHAGRHFAKCGDTSFIQDLYNDMRTDGKNVVRSSAYLAWLVAHFPVKLEQNKFVKDQELATKLNWGADVADGINDVRLAQLTKAEEKSFFDFAPEAVVENFKADTVIIALEKAVKKFENSKHYKAENPEAVAMLARAKSVITTLKAPAPANTDAQDISSAAA